MRTSKTPALALAALLAAGATGGLGYSFEANSRSIFSADLTPPRIAEPAPVKPLAVQPITDGTDAASRARSWFDATTGKFCLGSELNKTCH
jgi:hypothetical protein